MPSPDTFAAIALVAAVLLAVLAICRTAPGAGPRYLHGRRYHRAGQARHAMQAIEPASLSAPETVDPVSPYAPKTRTA